MKSFIAAVAVAATALVLPSCSSPAAEDHTEHQSGSESSPAAQPADFNADDIAFASNMIPHHQQAVALSELVPDRSTDPAVIKLAADIAAAQGPEIETMKVLLVQWREGGSGDEPAPDPHAGHGAPMQGMVDEATMKTLETLRGNEFDTLWLTSMIGHHRGAIEMAKAEIANGVNADAKNVAQHIVTSQEAEIAQMQQMGTVTNDE
jgi:uncharacterized protein (DUF305 family)